MSYLVDTTSIKKRFCNHDYRIFFPYGTHKATKQCIKCKKSFQLKIKSEKIIKYFPPAFEQSEINAEDKYRFLTNWKSFQCNEFTIPGVKEKHDWCGIWNTKGCLHVEDHIQSEHYGKIFVRQYKRGCFRASCEECYRRWQGRQSNRATRRIERFARKSGKKPIHIILSIPQYDYGLSLKGMRRKARLVLKEIDCIGGAIIFHPFRIKNQKLYWSPHFHIIGFGLSKSKISHAYGKYHWVIIDKGFRKSIFGTFHYNLDHCGVKKGVQCMVWFGDLSYSKLPPEKELDHNLCPACGRKLVEIYHDGVDFVVPPGENYEGFVDSEDWYLVKTDIEPLDNDFEYSSIRDLNELLKGLTLAN